MAIPRAFPSSGVARHGSGVAGHGYWRWLGTGATCDGDLHHRVRQIGRLPADGKAPYPLMVFASLLPWSFFSSSLAEASSSLISNRNAERISKIYFPRLIMPVAAVMIEFVDFLTSLGLFVALMIWYRFVPGWQIIFLPPFVALAWMAGLGIGTWITALNVKYRYFRYIVPFILQLGVYVSPVGFSSSIIPVQWRLFYSLHPLIGIIDGFRRCLPGGQGQFHWPGLVLSVCVSALFVCVGVRTFRKMERSFADLI